MNALMFLAVIAPSVVLGFAAGMGTAQMRVRAIMAEQERVERARQQGQIDGLSAKVKPTLTPPDDYYRGIR